MASYAQLAKKLQNAINSRINEKLLINTQQWFSHDKQRPITVYVIRKSAVVENKQRPVITDLFKTYSQVQMVLWLRDYWYKLNDWEIPTDNPEWEEVKKNGSDTFQ